MWTLKCWMEQQGSTGHVSPHAVEPITMSGTTHTHNRLNAALELVRSKPQQ